MTRSTIARRFAVLLWLTASPLFSQSVPPPAKAYNTTADIPYESVPNFIKMPAGLFLGEGMGVASNSKGHFFVFTREQASRLFEFDATGKFIREIGDGLYGFAFAHGVRVDSEDNIWAVDEGTNMVVKFTPDGRVAMLIGRRPEAVAGLSSPGPPPPPQPYVLNRPTDVCWGPAGEIFVADGYGNSRVVKYDKNGRFMKDVGSRGSGLGQLSTPHSIACDAQGNVYVADRGNSRISVFDIDLNPKTTYDNVGSPWTVCITPGPHQYLYSSNSLPDNNDSRIAAVTGEIYKMELDGTIIGKFGKSGKKLGEFETTHGMDCRNENELLISEIGTWRVQKIILHPAHKDSN